MWVLLANSHEHDRLPGRVHHVEGSANFLIDSIEFGHDDPVNGPWVAHIDGEVNQRLIELGQLVDRIVANQSFAHEEYHVRRVDVNQFGKLAHEPFIALHTPGSVDQDHVVMLVLRLKQSFLSDHSWIVLVSLLVERNFEASCMSGELLDRARPEVVAGSEHHFKVPLGFQVVGSLGK